ncbi:MAG: hypothetical protein WCK03_02325 [Candidatus Taylorbacteria bacterium]
MRDYQIASPSLEGVLNHDSLLYDGIKRPIEILRILDGPVSRGKASEAKSSLKNHMIGENEIKILQQYFYDLYAVFMKKLSHLLVEFDTSSDDNIKLQAILQEMIRIKKLLVTGGSKL